MSAGRHSLALALPCRECKAAAGQPCLRLDGNPRSRSHHQRTPLAPCGTPGGYQRHRKSGEDPCDECREANRRYMAQYRNRRPEKRAADIAALLTRREATRLLIERHRDEFDQLLADVRQEAS